MVEKTQNNFSIQEIVGVISIILSTHYFLSFKWLSGFFKLWDVNSLSIITIEDLTFPFANINLSLFVLTSFGFIGIFVFNFLNKKNKYSSPYKNLKSVLREFSAVFKKKSLLAKIMTFVIPTIIIGVYLFVFRPELKYPTGELEYIYLLILFGGPIAYIFRPSNRKTILMFQVFMMFGWSNFFIRKSLENIEKSSAIQSNSMLTFEYNNENVVTSDSLAFLYHGYKYLILIDKKEKIHLYPSKEIGKIEYIAKKK